jgi:hypothetical protein
MRHIVKLVFVFGHCVADYHAADHRAAPARGTNLAPVFARIAADLAANKPAQTADAIWRMPAPVSASPAIRCRAAPTKFRRTRTPP